MNAFYVVTAWVGAFAILGLWILFLRTIAKKIREGK